MLLCFFPVELHLLLCGLHVLLQCLHLVVEVDILPVTFLLAEGFLLSDVALLFHFLDALEELLLLLGNDLVLLLPILLVLLVGGFTLSCELSTLLQFHHRIGQFGLPLLQLLPPLLELALQPLLLRPPMLLLLSTLLFLRLELTLELVVISLEVDQLCLEHLDLQGMFLQLYILMPTSRVCYEALTSIVDFYYLS
jgi:hypothetical protein